MNFTCRGIISFFSWNEAKRSEVLVRMAAEGWAARRGEAERGRVPKIGVEMVAAGWLRCSAQRREDASVALPLPQRPRHKLIAGRFLAK